MDAGPVPRPAGAGRRSLLHSTMQIQEFPMDERSLKSSRLIANQPPSSPRLHSLPTEILLDVFSCPALRDLKSVCRSCKGLAKLNEMRRKVFMRRVERDTVLFRVRRGGLSQWPHQYAIAEWQASSVNSPYPRTASAKSQQEEIVCHAFILDIKTLWGIFARAKLLEKATAGSRSRQRNLELLKRYQERLRPSDSS